jgi:anti-sigma-K factor RskA
LSVSDEERLDQLAAEYVLGTLRGATCTRFEERMRADPALAARVRAWEARMAPLCDRYEPAESSDRVWAGIERRLCSSGAEFRPAGRAGSPVFWKRLTAGFASVAALCLAAMVYLLAIPAAPQCYAVLTDARSAPTAVVFDRRSMRELVVLPVGSRLAAGAGSAQLWIVVGSTAVPVGLLNPDGETRLPLAKPMSTAVMAPNARLLITREPAGGSRSGAPAGNRLAEGVVALL